MNLVRNILILLILCGIVLGDNVIWENETFSAHNTWDFGTNAVRGKNLYFVNIDGTTLTDGIAALTGGDWTAINNLTMGTATVNTGVFSMIQGGVASDPTFSITLAGDNAYIDQTIGDLYLSSDGTIFFDNPLYTNQTVTFGGTTVDYLLDLGDMDIGTITANGGNFQMTQGAVAGDPTFTITQSGNDVTINQTIGDMTISAGGGDISFLDENLDTTGTLDSGVHTINAADDTIHLFIGPSLANATTPHIRIDNGTHLGDIFVSDAGDLDLRTDTRRIRLRPLGGAASGIVEMRGTSVKLLWENDGAGSIGLVADNRPANIYVKTRAVVGTLNLLGGSITDTSDAISFGDENLSTDGTFDSGTHIITGDLIVNPVTATDTIWETSLFNSNLTGTRYTSGAGGAHVILRHVRGTEGSEGDLADGDTIGGINVQAWDETGAGEDPDIGAFSGTIGRTVFKADGNHAGGSLPTKFAIELTPDGGVATDRRAVFTIDQAGSALFNGGVTIADNFNLTLGGTGNIALGSGNISGSDLDISAGTGDWSTTGTNQFGRAGINGVPVTKSMLKIYQSGDGGANHNSFVSGLSIYGHDDRSDDVLTLYVDQYGQPVIWGKESISIAVGAGTHTNAKEIFGWTALNLDGVPTERTRFNPAADSSVTFFELSTSGENEWIRQYGWITADPAKKWIAWTVNDTDDTFQLTREDSFITAFDIVMPVTIGDGTNEMQVSSTGDTSWAGTGGLLYGNMDQENATSFTVTLTNQNDWYELDHATTGIVAGELNDVTFDGDHYLEVNTAGMYFVTYSLVCSINDTNQHIEFQILKNGNVTGKGESHTTFIASSRDLSCGSNTILDLAVDDEISIAARNVTVAGKIITIDHLEMTIFLIGGT